MSKQQSFKIEGIEELRKVLTKLPDNVKKRELIGMQKKIMANTKREARKQAKGPHSGKKSESASGQKYSLSKSINYKNGRSKTSATVYLGVQNKKGTFKAPHWWLVAKGTKERKFKSSQESDGKYKTTFTTESGRTFIGYISNTGKMPANPYMDIAFGKTKGAMSSKHATLVSKYLEKKIKTLQRRYKI